MDLSDDQIISLLSRSGQDEPVSDDDRETIQTFSKQLIAIAQLLRREDFGEVNDILRNRTVTPAIGQSSTNGSFVAPDDQDPPSPSRELYAELARKAYTTRRQRTGIFGTFEIFGEPAWDILLDLYIADFDNKQVSVSSACIGSASPPTTGLRWLGVLSDHGFVKREHDSNDQRRILVRLTDRALECMDCYFATALKSSGSA
ncbi:MAG: MarR family transcriptional regulator [Pseudomonadota bacterium]